MALSQSLAAEVAASARGPRCTVCALVPALGKDDRDALAAAMAEQRDVLEEVIEPYLIQQGLIQRTPRGRLLTETGWCHLDKPVPPGVQKQLALLPVEGEEE